MTMLLPPGGSVDDLILSPTGSCPLCAGPVRKWGYGRWRFVRGGERAGFRPERVRCVECRVTQVVLPADVLVRRRDAVRVVGRAWRSFAAGLGSRVVARELDVPMETVRGWLRRLRVLARVMCRRVPPPPGPARGDRELRWALSVVEAQAETVGCRGDAELWPFAAYRSQGRLLSTRADPV